MSGYDKISEKLQFPKSTRCFGPSCSISIHKCEFRRSREKMAVVCECKPKNSSSIIVKEHPRIPVEEIVEEQIHTGVNMPRHAVGRVLQKTSLNASLLRTPRHYDARHA